MKKYRFFYLAAIPIFILTCCITFLFYRFLGRATSSFIPEFQKIIKIREYIVEEKLPDFPRVFILSGSNSLFGIDARVLERKLHYPVINLGLHAALPASVYFYQVKKYTKKGDIVILPLELGYYTNTIASTEMARFYFENDLGYWSEFNWWQRFHFFFDYGREWGEHAFLAFFSEQNRIFRKRGSQKKIIKEWLKTPTTNKPYLSSSLDRSGCMLINSKPFPNWNRNHRQDPEMFDKEKNTRVTRFAWPPAEQKPNSVVLNSDFIKKYKQLQKYCKKNGLTLILTWPVIAFYNHKLYSDVYWALKNNNIEISGNPLNFVYNEIYFFDTPSHLNLKGAQLHSVKLSDDIAHLIPKRQNKYYNELLRLCNVLKNEQSSTKDYFAQDCLIIGDQLILGDTLVSGLFSGKMKFYANYFSLHVPSLLLAEFVLVPDNLDYLKERRYHQSLCYLAESLLKNVRIGKSYKKIDSFQINRNFSLCLFKRTTVISRQEANVLSALSSGKPKNHDAIGLWPNQVLASSEDIKYIDSLATTIHFSPVKPFHAVCKNQILYVFSPKNSPFSSHKMKIYFISGENKYSVKFPYLPVDGGLTPDNCKYYIFAYKIPPNTVEVQVSFTTSFVAYKSCVIRL